ncbi:hypothetical protein BWI17_12990 [Betaproteobacteria bacterium GR16-43]|nr:hypothetical protein BWI17_12990 [Betaproteobacteria bacterium GR16-43]
MTNATGALTRLRIADDGSVTIPGGNLSLANPSSAIAGSILTGTNRFIHNFGSGNTFLGELAGNFSLSGTNNTGSGANALAVNTTGTANTATGSSALNSNTTGSNNTAAGTLALAANTTGPDNTAVGTAALAFNTTGFQNTASGRDALFSNTTGHANTAVGYQVLKNTTTGSVNVGVGYQSLVGNTTGQGNTAIGQQALHDNTTGELNIAIGYLAGYHLSTGDFNIAIGSQGVFNDANTIRVGDSLFQSRTFIAGIRGITTGSANAIPVMIDSNGQLGTVSSSARFKDDIADMESSTDALMQLRPVTFHYKADQDPEGRTLQYGLVAEEVAQVYPGLVARTPDGQVETVMYQFLPSMLLNEFQKLRRANDAMAAELAEIKRMLGRQR